MKPLDWRLWTPLGVLALIVTGCLLGPVVVDADAIPAFSPGERRHRAGGRRPGHCLGRSAWLHLRLAVPGGDLAVPPASTSEPAARPAA